MKGETMLRINGEDVNELKLEHMSYLFLVTFEQMADGTEQNNIVKSKVQSLHLMSIILNINHSKDAIIMALMTIDRYIEQSEQMLTENMCKLDKAVIDDRRNTNSDAIMNAIKSQRDALDLFEYTYMVMQNLKVILREYVNERSNWEI